MTYECDRWLCPLCQGKRSLRLRDPFGGNGDNPCPVCDNGKVPAPRCETCDKMPSECTCPMLCLESLYKYDDESEDCGKPATVVAIRYKDGRVFWPSCERHAPKYEYVGGHIEPVAGRTSGELRRVSEDWKPPAPPLPMCKNCARAAELDGKIGYACPHGVAS